MFRPILFAATGLALAASAAAAQPRGDPDWPCVQRKVATLGPGSFWTGPDLGNASSEWGSDRAAAQLARKLASRRTDLNEVDGLLDEFTAEIKDKGERDKRLALVFAGVFEIINGERTTVINGITRYAQGQRKLAERIREEADKIGETTEGPPQQDATNAASSDPNGVQNAFAWDRRIFEERNQSVSYVCEVPTLLEQRLGELARKIQAKL